jgi:CSLREA domain-containing protein
MKYGSRSFHILQGIAGKLLLLITQLFLCLGIATVSQAATTIFNVNSFADEVDANPGDGSCQTASGVCSLRAAIQEANATSNTTDAQGNVQPHIINLPAGTYTLSLTGINEDQAATGDLDISGSVNIVGVDANGNPNADPSQTIIDGGGIDRVFQIMGTVSISNLTVQHGYVDADTNNNVSSGGGGGGGGIYNSGSLRIENCVIQNNQVIAATASGAGGGGLQTTGVAGTGPNTVKTVIVNSTISGNSAPLGGGVRNFFGSMNIDLTDVYNNTATQYSGGGIENTSGSMSITRSTIRYNTAQQSGGGVDNLDALDITQSSIYLNQVVGITTGGVVTAGGAGGGIFNGSAGALNLVNTTVSQNQAALAGGGIYNHKDVTVTNSTIYDNSVSLTTGGGGTEVFACGSQDTGSNCSTDIWVDPANHSKGLLIHTNFINTIVGNSSSADNCNGDAADLVISKGHNIETADTCGFSNSGDLNNVSPATLFSNILGFYGGDLGSLFALPISSSSPAYNAGDKTNCPATDERGFIRPGAPNVSECDIGAYGLNAVYSGNTNVLDLALDITDKVAAPLNGAVQVTITFSVANKGPLQATNVVLTGSIPTLSGLNITSLGSDSSVGSCTQSSTGFTCTIPSIDAYDSADFFVAVIATKAMSFDIGGEVKSDQVDNYRPDNLKTITIDIPTVAGNSVSGNNFAGSTGGGAMDWLSLAALFPTSARRLRHRKRFG